MMFLEITHATYINDFKLLLKFNDGVEMTVDLEHELTGSVFTPLKDKENFRKFSIVFNTIEWENGADFAPEYLYELAKYQHQIASEPISEYEIRKTTPSTDLP
jgi:hypothetical protein